MFKGILRRVRLTAFQSPLKVELNRKRFLARPARWPFRPQVEPLEGRIVLDGSPVAQSFQCI
jgi:hypothetical protein